MAAEEEENRIKGFTTNRSDLFLGDLCKCKRGAPLKVNIVGKGECCQRGQWGAGEEVGIRSIWVGSEYLDRGESAMAPAYFRGTATGLPRPPVRFPVARVHTTETC